MWARKFSVKNAIIVIENTFKRMSPSFFTSTVMNLPENLIDKDFARIFVKLCMLHLEPRSFFLFRELKWKEWHTLSNNSLVMDNICKEN